MFANASLIALVGYSLFFVSDLFVKGAHTYGLNAVEIAFFISVFMSFFVVAQRKLDAAPIPYNMNGWPLHVVRGAIHLIKTLSICYCLSHMSFSHLYVGVGLIPIVSTLFAYLFLQEKAALLDWVFILGAFAGVVVSYGSAGVDLDVSYLLLSVFILCIAIDNILLKKYSSYYTKYELILFPELIVGTCLFPFVFIFKDTINSLQLIFCACAALAVILGLRALLTAFSKGTVRAIAPMVYCSMILGPLSGWLLFGDEITLRLVIGASIVLICGVLLILSQPKEATPSQ